MAPAPAAAHQQQERPTVILMDRHHCLGGLDFEKNEIWAKYIRWNGKRFVNGQCLMTRKPLMAFCYGDQGHLPAQQLTKAERSSPRSSMDLATSVHG
jgi:hypothetical protein